MAFVCLCIMPATILQATTAAAAAATVTEFFLVDSCWVINILFVEFYYNFSFLCLSLFTIFFLFFFVCLFVFVFIFLLTFIDFSAKKKKNFCFRIFKRFFFLD